ncbi:hypothetical protein BRC83_10255 [Halobacteriales archaeon QS_1_68_17]|nr:MAG: hypothetical protein BRC83_10255 [Halobacteriales archaeon QS_1_68_17]
MTASSSAVYGTPESLPVEETQPTNPESPYAASKLAGEGYCRTYRNLHDLETVCLRYFNVYGPRQRGDSPYSGVIAIFARRAVEGQPLVIHGDGEQTRDFVHVSDVVAANVAAATIDDPAHLVYNVGTGESTSVADVVFHEAANVAVQRSVEDPEFDARSNVLGLIRGVADVVEHKR